jgi:hypothetical protein
VLRQVDDIEKPKRHGWGLRPQHLRLIFRDCCKKVIARPGQEGTLSGRAKEERTMLGSTRTLPTILLMFVIGIAQAEAAPISLACTGKGSAQIVVIDLDKGLVTVEGRQTPITAASAAKIEFGDGVLYGVFRLGADDVAYIAPSGAFTGQCK